MRRCLGCMEQFGEGYDLCPYCGYEVGTPAKEAYHMAPGSLLSGRYLIGKVLGFGGFGVTYIGWDQRLERKVAIKEYLPSEFSTRIPGQTQVTVYEGERTEQFNSGLGKFLDEARMLAKFESANGIVQIYNSFQENGTAYIIMEYLEGRTLKAYLEQKGKLPAKEAKEILHPIITALKSVHAMGILHRDIAPDNIFLTNDGKVKLLDFGASRFATTSHSKSLSVIIKPGYAPVEQYRSRSDQGPWTDVYSLAATFYKMVTGVTPEDAMERVEKEELKKPSRLGIEIPRNTEHAIMNALNIKVEDRTQSLEAFEKELYLDEKVKLRFVHLKKADVGRWPLWAKLAVSTAVLAVSVLAVLIGTGVIDYSRLIPEGFALPPGMTRVPNLVNEELDAADTLMADAELILQIVDKQYSEYIPQDLILSQNVNKGKIVAKELVVEVVVSGGREPVMVQDVQGYYREEAIELLTGLGLQVSIEEAYGEFAEGVVMAQSVGAGEKLYRGDEIVLTVSKGYDTYIDEEREVTIPNLAGMSLEQARKEAQKYGLSLAKSGSRVSGQHAPGTILEQTPAAGRTGHQGDVIRVVTAEEEPPVYMPDVQYKDSDAAVAELEGMGLLVTITYEESGAVAKGKVIRQSKTAYDVVTNGTEITLVVSSGTAEVNQVVAQRPEWSGWTDSLPAGVDGSGYEIETKKQYSFRDKSTTTSSQDSLDGWTLYDQTTAKGEYGDWSGWTTDKPASQTDREIEKKTQYASQDYQTTTSAQPTMAGWKQISVRTYYADDYGGWSEWSTTAASQSDTRDVETKTQYQSRTKEKTSSNSKTMNGYTLYDSSSAAGEWSGWSRTQVTASETESQKVEVDTRQGSESVPTGKKYHYFRYINLDTGWFSYKEDYLDENGAGRHDKQTVVFDSPLQETTQYKDPNDGSIHAGYSVPGRGGYFFWDYEETVYTNQSYTEYRSRTITYTYYFWKWGGWSGWTDTKLTPNADTEVNPQTLYRYRDKIPHYEYTFERWTDWTGWSDSPIAETGTRKVKTQEIYKYRDKQDVITYHYYKWSDWSDYRDEKTEASETREIQERTQYRYRKK